MLLHTYTPCVKDSQLQVRSARPSDREALGALAAALVRMHHELNPRRFMSSEGIEAGYGRWLIKESTEPSALVFVAELAGQVVGYTYARLEEKSWNDLLEAHGKLHDVFVIPSARKLGAARLLVEAACKELERRGAPRILLATAVENEPAQRLFASLGFRTTMVEMTREAGSA